MKLAKPAMDVGLFTNQLEPMLQFWQDQVGLAFSELLPVGGGIRQHRHAIGDTVFKLNHSRDPLEPAAPSGIEQLSIASNVSEARTLQDPDGNVVKLVPQNTGVEQMRVHLTVADVDRAVAFYGGVLGFPEVGAGVLACGVTQIEFAPGSPPVDPAQRAQGYRYMTVQVFDVLEAHAHVLANGGQEGRAPVKLGDVAHISFVRDPDGNWIELSQRKSIVGAL